MDALVYLGMMAVIVIAMAIFAVAEEAVRRRRMRERQRLYADLVRSGIVKPGDLN